MNNLIISEVERHLDRKNTKSKFRKVMFCDYTIDQLVEKALQDKRHKHTLLNSFIVRNLDITVLRIDSLKKYMLLFKKQDDSIYEVYVHDEKHESEKYTYSNKLTANQKASIRDEINRRSQAHVENLVLELVNENNVDALDYLFLHHDKNCCITSRFRFPECLKTEQTGFPGHFRNNYIDLAFQRAVRLKKYDVFYYLIENFYLDQDSVNAAYVHASKKKGYSKMLDAMKKVGITDTDQDYIMFDSIYASLRED